MPTIRFVTPDGEHLVEADRVLRDSLSYAAERRVDGRWLRVATLPRSTVLLVQRRLPGRGPPGWLTEDVRTAAGPDAGESVTSATVTST